MLRRCLFLLWVLKGKYFVIFNFGDDPLAYVQFVKSGNNLILDFPYSTTRRDRLTKITQNHKLISGNEVLHSQNWGVSPFFDGQGKIFIIGFLLSIVFLSIKWSSRTLWFGTM